MKNKIIAHLTIILILVGVFCNVCTTYNRLSVYDSSVYAEADNWTGCDSSDLVTAFRYYCKSRNLAIEGSIADALTGFTTTTFNNICSKLGIDTTSLSAELKKTTEGNLGLRFLFSNTGITAYNRIFAEFLQNNDLSVGDEVEDKNIFSGLFYNGHAVFNVSSSSPSNGNKFISIGTAYNPYDRDYLISNTPASYSITPFNNQTISVQSVNTSSNYITLKSSNGYSNIIYKNSNGYPYDFACLGYYVVNGNINTLYFGYLGLFRYSASSTSYNSTADAYATWYNANGISNGDVYITTNNDTINNNTYNNNFVIIYNDGDTYISDDDNEPLPTTPPGGGGGGGGGDNPDNPDIPPVDPTPTPPPTIPDWDIELPEMPTGNDWLLYGLEKKFPWDIPFNLMYMLSLFAADPETPHFEGTLDLKIVQWNYDIDLAPFDDIAGYVRNIEFIGFLIGLMLLTNKLIWG